MSLKTDVSIRIATAGGNTIYLRGTTLLWDVNFSDWTDGAVDVSLMELKLVRSESAGVWLKTI